MKQKRPIPNFFKNEPFAWAYQLPDVPAEPPIATPTPGIRVVIPIFQNPSYYTHPTGDTFLILSSITRSALWARWTWLNNTDAVERKVAIQLYIEDLALPHIEGILKENHITNSDIVIFHAEPIPAVEGNPNGDWGRLAKCICPFYDETLMDIDTLVVIDSDIFVPKGKAPLPIFEYLAGEDSGEIGLYMKEYSYANRWKVMQQNQVRGYPFQTEKVKMLLDGSHPTRSAWGVIYVLPRSIRQSPMIQELKQETPYIGDDELLVTAMVYKHNVPIYDLSEDMQILAIENYERVHTQSPDFWHGHVPPKLPERLKTKLEQTLGIQ